MYTKLRNDRQIRLMTLNAGQAGDSISCSLRRVNLSKSLKFEALSYEWKQAHGLTSITCNGTPRPVTHNLALALRALRLSSSPRVLWVDAVCINQEDPEEKAKQIPLMREIYASATSVLTWLGPDFPGAKEAFDILPYLSLVGIERHSTGKPDTEKIEDIMAASLTERPKHGSIIQTQGDFMFFTHDRDSVMWRTIRRHPELDDDVLFRFHDRKAWNAIDQLFCNTYFERSWIIQEVAVAEMVYVLCGSYILPWDIFRMAYEGRSKLLFQRFRSPLADEFPSLVPCVRDARLRYPNSDETRCQDLATVLTSFSYSKQMDPRDMVYAALGLITLQSPCADIVPDYSKSTEDVFYEASCQIIRSRKDLCLWSCKTLMSRRSMPSLPSWVPEWTMKPCEEALEFASPPFSRSLPGNPFLYNRRLFVDGHLLDVVDATFSFDHDLGEFKLVWELDQWLRKHGKSIFGAYSAGLLDSSMTPTPSQGTTVEASQLLRDNADIPLCVAEVFRNIKPDNQYPLPYRMLNIEAMWSTLTAIFKRRIKRPRPPGYRLFLALLYIYPQLVRAREPIGHRLPHSFNSWIVAAILLLAQGEQTKLLQEIFSNHFEMNDSFHGIRDSFFVTNKGYFGRAPAETVKRGQVVAVLGGAYVPYLWQKQNDHYQLISHAVPGWDTRAGGIKQDISLHQNNTTAMQ
ncbi:heterokaryon incompatibility protein-domain-containing protein [Fusarium solani]|uniref:Heterokaryon incompatibility protein-domain-containing protein n=1 Tax=Fusarium solani TaxID=169388 RepID=A0A9P9KT12_FUSSL|nr:heterokaryon incompatibility protein-domain-containing protein [Fusarium solani]KAH7267942.1 heterokaryon incompatibility protein-domain-containing protein [Fusarium solani]